MDSFVNRIKQTSLNLAESLTPVLKDSKFKLSGRINPEEFVLAGDHLVYTCPSWNWSSGDESKIKSYLPKDKQFLVTRNVPCLRRCKEMEDYGGIEKLVEEEEGNGDGWVTHETGDNEYENESPAEMTLENMNLNDEIDKKANNDNDDDEGEALDMEDFEQSGQLETVDPSVAIIAPKSSNTTECDTEGDSIVHTRTYDLYITYNKYYQTPHIFLIGFDENRKMLSMEQMFEDVSQDNAKKTVTLESHPHLGISLLAVHPCRHSDLMKKFIQIAEEGGNELSVHCYLILFLKFVQSVVPTINYDFSQMIKTN